MEKRTVDKALFGQRFSELLRTSGETTYSIAAALSMSPGTISRYANGLMAPQNPHGPITCRPLWRRSTVADGVRCSKISKA